MNFLSIKQDKKRILAVNLAVSLLISALIIFFAYLNLAFFSTLTRTFINNGAWLIIIACMLFVLIAYDMTRLSKKTKTFVMQIDRIIEYENNKPIRQIRFTNITDITTKKTFIDDVFRTFTVSLNNGDFVMDHIPRTDEIIRAIENLNYYNRYA